MKVFNINLIVLSIIILFISCEPNKRSFGQFLDKTECIKNSHCELGFICGEDNYCRKDCNIGFQDNDHNGICQLSCSNSNSEYFCYDINSICDDLTGEIECKCRNGYQDNDNNGSCESDCSIADLECQLNAHPYDCDDSSGISIPMCVCNDGYQDNDNNGICGRICEANYQDNDEDGICKPSCSIVDLDCGEHRQCFDNSGNAICGVCEMGWEFDLRVKECIKENYIHGVDYSVAMNNYGGFYNSPNFPSENFALLKLNGDLIIWSGDIEYFIDDNNIFSIYSNEMKFVALRNNRSLLLLYENNCDNETDICLMIYVDIVSVYSTVNAFAALKSDGSIIAWGNSNEGGFGAPTDRNYVKIYSTSSSFAALKEDGSITVWGNSDDGGVGAPIDSGYVKIYSTISTFAALKADGSIVMWGNIDEAPTGTGYIIPYGE